MRASNRIPSNPPLAALALLIAALVPTHASAQEASFDRWHVTLYFGSAIGTQAAGQMEDELRRQQWNDDSPAFFGIEGSSNPVSSEGDYAHGYAAGYRLTSRFGVGAVLGTDYLGYASGYRANDVAFGAYMRFNPSVRTYGALGTFHLTGAYHPLSVRVDAGPALFRARGSGDDEVTSHFGGVVGAGIAYKVWHFRLSADMQRRYVGDVAYGGRTETDPFTGDVHTFDEAIANFDHDSVMIGLGVAF